jgi:hypothetical protein
MDQNPRVEGISQPWHCLAPRLSAKSQGSWVSWKEVYRAVASSSMLSVEIVSCNTFITPKDDIRHPEDADLEELFSGRYGLVHIGTWDAQGHPYDDSCISRDTLTSSSTKFSYTYQLLRDLAMLTRELSIIFAAFNCNAWSHARGIVNSLSHLFPVSNIARTCDYEAWTMRAVLCNLFTHVHRNLRDEKFGYAAIVVFGSFTYSLFPNSN